MVLDFGESEEVIDAAEGLSAAVEEADLIPAYHRRKPRKQRDESNVMKACQRIYHVTK